MSKSVVLRLTMKSSSAFRPPSLYAPPVTAPPASTNATRGLRLRDVRSLLWTIVSPMVPPNPTPPSARSDRRWSAASLLLYYSTSRATGKPKLPRCRWGKPRGGRGLCDSFGWSTAKLTVGGGHGVGGVDVDPARVG